MTNTDYSQLGLQELYDILARDTYRYNEILVHGGSVEEFKSLKESILKVQQEIEIKRQVKKKKEE